MAFWGYGDYPQYKSVAQRQAEARAKIRQLTEGKKLKLDPVTISGSRIVSTFWGKAWCDNLVAYQDYASRLPRGRSYVRSGSVIDLQIAPGRLDARVMGSSLYDVGISIQPLNAARWSKVVSRCHGQIASLVELLKGNLPKSVLELLTEPGHGLFPEPGEIAFSCSCPDSAAMCKHIAATLYGVGARLDSRPELFFTLRQVKQEDLLAKLGESAAAPVKKKAPKALAGADLSAMFGIDLGGGAPAAPKKARKQRPVSGDESSAPPSPASTPGAGSASPLPPATGRARPGAASGSAPRRRPKSRRGTGRARGG